MYLIYVDESGDIGLTNSPTSFFCLSGLVLHELRWLPILEEIVAFRRALRARYGLKLRQEIRAHAFIQRPGKELQSIQRSVRLKILGDVLRFEASLPDISIINIVVDKTARAPGFDIFDFAWKTLIQRFHNTLSHRNFPGPQNPEDRGLVIMDRTDQKKLQLLLRRGRRFNPVPSLTSSITRQLPLITMVEDPNPRDSKHSYFTQLADVNAYFLHQRMRPCRYIRKKGATRYFDLLDPVLCKVASRTDPQGIVRL
jgi:hypothetical protein